MGRGNVTINLNGHTIEGNCSAGAGIAFEFGSSMHVSNGNISNWETGVYGYQAPSSSVSHITVKANCPSLTTGGNFTTGVALQNQPGDPPDLNDGWTLQAITVTEPASTSTGIFVNRSNNNNVSGNNVSDGIVLDRTTNNVIHGNTINSGTGGVEVFGGSGNSIISNTTNDNINGPGIILTGGTSGNLVTLNTANGNTPFDLFDDDTGVYGPPAAPNCGGGTWQRDTFRKANQTCIH